MTVPDPTTEALSERVDILIPTTGRRALMLQEVLLNFALYSPSSHVRTIQGYTWGEGLNRLAAEATEDYWVTCCDDTVPYPGWFTAAREMLDQGFMPVQRYFTVEGEPLHEFDAAPHGTPLPWSRGYLLTREIYEQVGPFLDASWYVDFDYSERLITAGWELRACDGYSFTHLDGERDWLTAEVGARERALYEASFAARATT